jgi:hypothetical protein
MGRIFITTMFGTRNHLPAASGKRLLRSATEEGLFGSAVSEDFLGPFDLNPVSAQRDMGVPGDLHALP